MARSLPSYRCILLDRAGVPTGVVHLAVPTDSDAIVAGITLAHEDRNCRGFEIREADRLVFLQTEDVPSPARRAPSRH